MPSDHVSFLSFYQDLLIDSPIFSRIMDEYGTMDKKEDVDGADEKEKKEVKPAQAGPDPSKSQALMQAEERVIGSVSGQVYLKYFRYAGGVVLIPLLLLVVTLYQGSQGKCCFPEV